MITNKNVGKYLWVSVVAFLTYLFLGSFIVSKDFLELAYLLVFYSFIVFVKINDKK